MYYYGYGNGCYNSCVTPCYPTYTTGYNCGCSNGFGGYGATGWIAIILVVFLILVICGFTRNNC